MAWAKAVKLVSRAGIMTDRVGRIGLDVYQRRCLWRREVFCQTQPSLGGNGPGCGGLR